MLKIVLLCPLIGLGQTQGGANMEVAGIALPSMEVGLAGYESQGATRDPLPAMDVLDSLAGLVFFKGGDYDLSWNPQTQELEASLPGTDIQIAVSTGIDAVGRQTFQILIPDENPLTGWVDVDVPHQRVMVSEDQDMTRTVFQLSGPDSYGMRSINSVVAQAFCTCTGTDGSHHNLCTHDQCRDAAECRIELSNGNHDEGTCYDVTSGGVSIGPAQP